MGLKADYKILFWIARLINVAIFRSHTLTKLFLLYFVLILPNCSPSFEIFT
ncbi:hypothetical protein Q668_13550 [Alcanivorax sp. PN-3]|nr:hypothetical protein Q668_13550 [Alcanivorax sp. PN-3]